MIRRIGAVIFGFIAGFFIFVLIQGIIASKFPPETAFNANDTEAMTAYFRSLPDKFFLYILAAHSLASLVASFLGAKVADKYKLYLGLLVGGMFLVAAITYIMTIPTPSWMLIADPLIIMVFSFLGAKLGSRK